MNHKLLIAAVLACLAVSNVTSSPAQTGKSPAAGGGAPDAKDPDVEKLEAAALKAEKESVGKPKDAKLKAKAADAYYLAGHAKMMSPKLAPRVKYRGALKLFKKALEFNPKHAKAKTEKETIEKIYADMGIKVD